MEKGPKRRLNLRGENGILENMRVSLLYMGKVSSTKKQYPLFESISKYLHDLYNGSKGKNWKIAGTHVYGISKKLLKKPMKLKFGGKNEKTKYFSYHQIQGY